MVEPHSEVLCHLCLSQNPIKTMLTHNEIDATSVPTNSSKSQVVLMKSKEERSPCPWGQQLLLQHWDKITMCFFDPTSDELTRVLERWVLISAMVHSSFAVSVSISVKPEEYQALLRGWWPSPVEADRGVESSVSKPPVSKQGGGAAAGCLLCSRHKPVVWQILGALQDQ